MEGDRFEIRYDRWCGWLLAVLGLGRRRSRVVVGDQTLRVAMGWAFRATVPVGSITSARRRDDPRVLGWGVHGWRGRWLVNGSSRGLVSVAVDPPAPSRIVGMPGRLRELIVSVEEPDRFVEALGGVSAAAHR